MQSSIVKRILILSFISVVAIVTAPGPIASGQGIGLPVTGLKDQVVVRRDSRSVPYIKARNDADLYFAQGYETARDRLWQMDLFRRLARGRTAEIFGKPALPQDQRWRRYGFSRIAEESVRVMDPALKKALEDYARGVNAYIASLDKTGLPSEFKVLQYEPEPWTPEDTVVIGKILADALSSTWTMDVQRLRLQALPDEKKKELLSVSNELDVVLFGKDGEGESKKEKVESKKLKGESKKANAKKARSGDNKYKNCSPESSKQSGDTTHLAKKEQGTAKQAGGNGNIAPCPQ